ncbi:MAG TPA: hypothetical protein VGG37_00900 [Opitutaceae bacterium]|jgi:hypothetical protein
MRPNPAANRAAPLLAALAVAALAWAGGAIRSSHGEVARFPLEHANVGYALAEGRGFSDPFGIHSGPTAWVPPGFPLLFAGAIRASAVLGAREAAVIEAVNLFAAAAAAWLVLAFCLRSWRPASRWLFAAALAAYFLLDGDFLASTDAVMAAVLALLLAGLSLCWYGARPAAGLGMTGVACAILAATHPGLALAGAAVSVAVGLAHGRTRFALVAAAAAGIAAGALPWALRNHAVFGRWIPSKSNGPFELVLSQNETDDGVLGEAALVAGHPSTNPRLLSEYVRLGETGFLEPYRTQAGRILREETGTYARFCLDRLFNAVCLSRSPSDIEPMAVRPAQADVPRLVGHRLALVCAGTPVLFWAESRSSASGEEAALRKAGIGGVGPLLADWTRAQAALRHRSRAPATVFWDFAWSGLPSLFVIAAAAAGPRRMALLLVACGAIYLVALVPNVLITHDVRHQGNFAVLFAIFAAGAAEAHSRSAAARGPLPAERPAK